MLQIRNLSNALQKRLIRPLYAHTQATPYAASLHSTLRNTDGSIHVPTIEDLSGSGSLNYSAATFSLQGGLVPGTVVVKAAGETVVPSNGASGLVTFGLLANFVGGTLDDLKDNNEVGVWRGPDAVFELLYPSFVVTQIAAGYAAATPGVPAPLYAHTNGLLAVAADATNDTPVVANLIEVVGSGTAIPRIVIDLKV